MPRAASPRDTSLSRWNHNIFISRVLARPNWSRIPLYSSDRLANNDPTQGNIIDDRAQYKKESHFKPTQLASVQDLTNRLIPVCGKVVFILEIVVPIMRYHPWKLLMKCFALLMNHSLGGGFPKSSHVLVWPHFLWYITESHQLAWRYGTVNLLGWRSLLSGGVQLRFGRTSTSG